MINDQERVAHEKQLRQTMMNRAASVVPEYRCIPDLILRDIVDYKITKLLWCGVPPEELGEFMAAYNVACERALKK